MNTFIVWLLITAAAALGFFIGRWTRGWDLFRVSGIEDHARLGTSAILPGQDSVAPQSVSPVVEKPLGESIANVSADAPTLAVEEVSPEAFAPSVAAPVAETTQDVFEDVEPESLVRRAAWSRESAPEVSLEAERAEFDLRWKNLTREDYIHQTDLQKLPGLSPKEEDALVTLGRVNSLDQLRVMTSRASSRETLAFRSGISPERISHIVSTADLSRIPGISPEKAAALSTAGIRSTHDLGRTFVDDARLSGLELGEDVGRWIEEAKLLPRQILD